MKKSGILLCCLVSFPALAQQTKIRFDQPYERVLYADCGNKMKITPSCGTCSEVLVSAANAEVIKTEEKDNYIIVPNKQEDLGWGIPQPLPVTIYVNCKQKKKWIIDSLVISHVWEPPTPKLKVIAPPKILYGRLSTDTFNLERRAKHIQVQLSVEDNYFYEFLREDNRWLSEKVEVVLLEKDKIIGKKLGEFHQFSSVLGLDIIQLWEIIKNEDLKPYKYVGIRCIATRRMNFKGEFIIKELKDWEGNWSYFDLDPEY